MSHADFWSGRGRMDEDERATPSEVAAMRAYVEQEVGLEETLKALMSTREDECPLDEKSDRVGELIRDVAIEIPKAAAHLATLIEGILHMKPEDMGWTEEQKKRFPNWQEWPDGESIIFPILTAQEDSRGMRFTPAPCDTLEVTMNEFTNINILFAHWYLINNHAQKKYAEFFGIRYTLEKTVPPQGEASDNTNPSQYDIEIQGNTPFLRIYGKEIYRMRNQRDAFPIVFPPDHERTDMIDPEGAEDLWHGEPGFGVERWHFWKNRLHELRENGPIREDTKQVIDQTLAEMDQFERDA